MDVFLFKKKLPTGNSGESGKRVWLQGGGKTFSRSCFNENINPHRFEREFSGRPGAHRQAFKGKWRKRQVGSVAKIWEEKNRSEVSHRKPSTSFKMRARKKDCSRALEKRKSRKRPVKGSVVQGSHVQGSEGEGKNSRSCNPDRRKKPLSCPKAAREKGEG